MLLAKCEELAHDLGAGLLWFPYLPTSDSATVSNFFSNRAIRLFTDVETEIIVRFETFDDYLDSLSSHQRTSVRKERRQFQASGAQVTETTLDQARDIIPPLYANLLDKYGGRNAGQRAILYINRLADQFGQEGLVWLCHRNDRLAGFSLFLPFNDAIYARFVGFDYAHSRPFDYFNLLVYEPLIFALRHKKDRIHIGSGSFAAKLLRGAVANPLWSVLPENEPVSQEIEKFTWNYNLRKISSFDSDFWSFARHQPRFTEWSSFL